jgi:hypothetical protein
VELPREANGRAKVFRLVGRIERNQGYSPSPDNGQDYLYVKLD